MPDCPDPTCFYIHHPKGHPHVTEVRVRDCKPACRSIPPSGTVIEIEGGIEFVSNGFVWLGCTPGDDATVYPAWTPEKMNKRKWRVVAWPMVKAPEEGYDW